MLTSLLTDTLQAFLERYDIVFKKKVFYESDYSMLEKLIDDYTTFILSPVNKREWEKLSFKELDEMSSLIDDLREKSSYGVAIIEKYRAHQFLSGNDEVSPYFENIEECIEKEFGSSRIDQSAHVLLIGSGSYPMTLSYIAKMTGATVSGIDIDDEAIELGRQVLNRLNQNVTISLENKEVSRIPHLKSVTHIIFSSTIPIKYDILEELYELTNPHVVIAMRYGNDFKSLFNYPMQPVDIQKWHLVENVIQDDRIFDIAIYKKR